VSPLFVVALCALTPLAALSVSCAGESGGDPHSNNGVPPPGGKDKRIRDLRNPETPDQKALVDTIQAVSGALVIAVDNFDETGDGRSTGTIYVQDIGSKDPYSGISLFSPTFSPGNLRVSAADVLDLRGMYQENQTRPVTFAPGAVLPQIAQPVATFRYEASVPEPIDIDLNDLLDYQKGSRWFGMLVRVKNVTLAEGAGRGNENNGRLAVNLLPPLPNSAGNKCDSPFPKVPEMTNDLFDVSTLDLKAGTTIKSLVGVVGYFCNLKILPRSAADIQL